MSTSLALTLVLMVMTVGAVAIILLPLLFPGRPRPADDTPAPDAAAETSDGAASSGDASGPDPAGGTAAAARTGRRAPASALVAALGLPVAAFLAYQQLSNFDWANLQPGATPAAAGVPDDAINRLARRLESQGGTLEEWRLLGRSQFQAGRFEAAESALREAYRQAAASGDPQLQAAAGAEYAEAMIFADQRALLSDAGTLLERVLALDPDNARALWWGGLGAFEQGQYERSVGRWTKLLENPGLEDESMRNVVRQRVALAERLAAEGAPPPAQIRSQIENGLAAAQAQSPGGPAGEEAAPGRPDRAQATAEGVPVSLRVSVALSPDLDALEDGRAHPLFVIARRPGAGGPPLAVVRRQSSELPFEVELSDDDAMIPGRGISSVDEVEVVARIALGGTPVASSGDLFGSERVRVDRDALVEITISERTP